MKVYGIFGNGVYTGFTKKKKIAENILLERNLNKDAVWIYKKVEKDCSDYFKDDVEYYYDDIFCNAYVNDKEISIFYDQIDSTMISLESTFSSGLNATLFFLQDNKLVKRLTNTMGLLHSLVELSIYTEDVYDKYDDKIEDMRMRFDCCEVYPSLKIYEYWEEFLDNYIYPF